MTEQPGDADFPAGVPEGKDVGPEGGPAGQVSGQGGVPPGQEEVPRRRSRESEGKPGPVRAGGDAPNPRSPRPRPRPAGPGQDMLSDFQRWLLRSSARNMRNQIGEQVRKTLGGRQPEPGNVWDVATTEIPPEVGESPECQWCPICRAARRMRESSPGLGGQLTAAGDAVAAAVQDALSGLESLLARGDDSGENRDAAQAATGPARSWAEARDEWAEQHGARVTPHHGAEQDDRPLEEGDDTVVGPAPDPDELADLQALIDDAPDGPGEPDDRG
jgi:hypothetical protein